MQRFWLWLIHFAYRRIAMPFEGIPTGLPLMRDPSSPCEHYSPRPRNRRGFSDCETDGHYLCINCALISEKALIAYELDIPFEGKRLYGPFANSAH